MATRKRIHHRRKPAAAVVHHRAPVQHRAPARRRRHYSRKPKTILSEAFNPAAMRSTGSAIISGAVGFFAVYQLNKTMQAAPSIQRVLLGSAVALISGAWMGMPNLASGMAGAVMLDVINTQQNKMNEGSDFLAPHELKQLPAVLSEDFLAASYMNAPNYLAAPYMSDEEIDYEDMD